MTDRTAAMAKTLAGHDKDELFVIIREQEPYVFLADGTSRTMSQPKRKNRKHIQIIHDMEEQKRRSLLREETLTDQEIKRSIQCYKRKSQV